MCVVSGIVVYVCVLPQRPEEDASVPFDRSLGSFYSSEAGFSLTLELS